MSIIPEKAPLALTVTELEALVNFSISNVAAYTKEIGRLNVYDEPATIGARLDYLKALVARTKVIITAVIDARRETKT